MPLGLISSILKYGYLIIFFWVFLQEIGVPTPVPNELVLLFSGYLASIGKMNFVLVMITVISADFIGTSLVYFIFYFLGQYIFKKNFRWLPRDKIERLTKKISERGYWSIYLGRLLPYLRGYASVAAGFLRVKPWVFLPLVLASAATWSGGYVLAGRLLGSEYEVIANKFDAGKIMLAGAVLLIIIFFVWPKISKRLRIKKDA